jgi:hypothetical protein
VVYARSQNHLLVAFGLPLAAVSLWSEGCAAVAVREDSPQTSTVSLSPDAQSSAAPSDASSSLAPGPLTEIVVTKDGSTYQGELVEKEPGKEVTVKLATGELKRFDWNEVASATDNQTQPPATPSGVTDQADGASQNLETQSSNSDTTPSQANTAAWGTIAVGVQSGYETPLGWIGGVVEWGFPRFLGVEAGFGIGSGLGWTASQWITQSFLVSFLSIGCRAGLFETFLSGSYQATHLGAPNVAYGLSVDVDVTIPVGPIEVRPLVGLAWTLSDLCPPGDCNDPTPIAFYAGAELLWSFPLGPK